MRRAALLAAVLVASALGCGPADPVDGATGLLMEHFRAVQAGDLEALARTVDDCRTETLVETQDAPAGCRERLAAALSSSQAQRDAGSYRFDDPWGFGLARALVLGAGGWWLVEHLEVTAPDRFRATLLVRTHYRQDETAKLPPGAVVEYLVKPLGTVKRLARGSSGPGALREELVQLELRAELVRSEEGWRVVSIEPLPDTAVWRSVSWRPL